MQITFLKAGNGDAILIKHNHHNVLIDGGNDSTYTLQQTKVIFEKNEALDLLIITHHDDDHIKGIIDLLKMISENFHEKKASELIKKVMFNSPRREQLQADPHLLSFRQAREVEELLLKNGIKWDDCTDKTDPVKLGELELSFLSPTEEDRQDYVEKHGEYLTNDYRCDWKSPIKTLEAFVDDDSQDNSLYNRSSIVVLCQCEGKKVLLPGDTTPKRLEVITKHLREKNNGEPVKLDFMTLPHHGSYRNINKAIVQNIKCLDYIISTNSQKYFLPNKRAILKILKYLNRGQHEEVHFRFNYREALFNLNFTEDEKKKYGFSTSPNNKEYGFLIV